MLSMTGFGRAPASVGTRRIVVEVRSVNHRGCDVKVRGQDIDAACEVEIVRAVRTVVHRGAVQVGIRDESAAGALIDAGRIAAVYAALETVRKQLGVAVPLDLGAVAAFSISRGAGAAEGGVVGEGATSAWAAVEPALGAALVELQAMRKREGQAMAADLKLHAAQLRHRVGQMAEQVRTLPTRAAERLKERLQVLLASARMETAGKDVALDPGRLAQEVAYLAEKMDVSEEIARLQTHLAHLDELLDGKGTEVSGGVGRKLEFLLQEIGREINTLGSKVQDAAVAVLVIEGKSELEKMREQVQNIE